MVYRDGVCIGMVSHCIMPPIVVVLVVVGCEFTVCYACKIKRVSIKLILS